MLFKKKKTHNVFKKLFSSRLKDPIKIFEKVESLINGSPEDKIYAIELLSHIDNERDIRSDKYNSYLINLIIDKDEDVSISAIRLASKNNNLAKVFAYIWDKNIAELENIKLNDVKQVYSTLPNYEKNLLAKTLRGLISSNLKINLIEPIGELNIYWVFEDILSKLNKSYIDNRDTIKGLIKIKPLGPVLAYALNKNEFLWLSDKEILDQYLKEIKEDELFTYLKHFLNQDSYNIGSFIDEFNLHSFYNFLLRDPKSNANLLFKLKTPLGELFFHLITGREQKAAKIYYSLSEQEKEILFKNLDYLLRHQHIIKNNILKFICLARIDKYFDYVSSYIKDDLLDLSLLKYYIYFNDKSYLLTFIYYPDQFFNLGNKKELYDKFNKIIKEDPSFINYISYSLENSSLNIREKSYKNIEFVLPELLSLMIKNSILKKGIDKQSISHLMEMGSIGYVIAYKLNKNLFVNCNGDEQEAIRVFSSMDKQRKALVGKILIDLEKSAKI